MKLKKKPGDLTLNTENLINYIGKKEGEKEYLIKIKQETHKQIKELKIKQKRAEQALTFIKKIALDTQKGLEVHISETVTAALETVFEDPYDFEVVFIERRGKTECDLFFVKEGNFLHPFTASGVGAVDVAVVGLRALSIVMKPDCPNILIGDEMFKHLKGEEENRLTIELMNKISKEMGIQIITISDERAAREDIIAGADKVFLTTQKNGVSIVKEAS